MVNWVVTYRGKKIDTIPMENNLNKKEVHKLLTEDHSYPESIKVRKAA